MSLSDVQIRSLKPRDRIYKISDANSLYLEVHPTGARLWRFKYSWHGKQKRIALGAYPNVGLAEARRKRDETRLLIHEGVDPLADRKRQKLVGKYKASNRFGDLAGEYIEMVTKEGRSEATIEKMKWLLEKLRPIADTPIADLQAVDLFAVLKKIEAQGRFCDGAAGRGPGRQGAGRARGRTPCRRVRRRVAETRCEVSQSRDGPERRRIEQGEGGPRRYGEEPAPRPPARVAARKTSRAVGPGCHERENAVP